MVAKGLTIMLVHNFDALATKDYLDTRFSEFETRIEAKMDKRFVGVDGQFSNVGKQFVMMDKRFDIVDKQFVEFRAEMRGEISDIRATLKLQSWVSAVLVAGIFVPLLQKLAV